MERTELINKIMTQVKLLDTEKKNLLIESIINNMTSWPIKMLAIELGIKIKE